MRSLKFYDYFFSIVLLVLVGTFIPGNAQTGQCDSCKITKEVRRQYFKTLYINYYKTYSENINKENISRKVIAQAFIIYLHEFNNNEVEDYVENFKKNYLNDVEVKNKPKKHFRGLTSPYEKISSYIENCESNNIDYTEDNHKDALIDLFKKIDKEVNDRVNECEKIYNKVNDTTTDDIQQGQEEESFLIFIEANFVWVLIGVLIILLFFKKLSKRKKSSRENKGKRLRKVFILGNKIEQQDSAKKNRKKKKESTSKNLQPPTTGKNKTLDEPAHEDAVGTQKETNSHEKDKRVNEYNDYNDAFFRNEDVSTDNPSSIHETKDEEGVKQNQRIWQGNEVASASDDSFLDAREYTASNNELSRIQSTQPPRSSNEVKTEYFPDPSSERSFLIKDGKSEISFRSLYKITHSSNSNIGRLEFLESVDYQVVFNSLERYVYPVCEQNNAYIHNTTLNIKQLAPGKVEIQGNKWYVTKKISIEFYQ